MGRKLIYARRQTLSQDSAYRKAIIVIDWSAFCIRNYLVDGDRIRYTRVRVDGRFDFNFQVSNSSRVENEKWPSKPFLDLDQLLPINFNDNQKFWLTFRSKHWSNVYQLFKLVVFMTMYTLYFCEHSDKRGSNSISNFNILARHWLHSASLMSTLLR